MLLSINVHYVYIEYNHAGPGVPRGFRDAAATAIEAWEKPAPEEKKPLDPSLPPIAPGNFARALLLRIAMCTMYTGYCGDAINNRSWRSQ